MFSRALGVSNKVCCNLFKSRYRQIFMTRCMTSKATQEIQSCKVFVNGVNLHYERTGHGSHIVLLLPGALGSSRTDFGPQLEELNKDHFTLIAVDPRGYGKSIPPERDWPLHYYHRDADDAAAIMNELGLQKYSILGWSDGGILGMVLAARYPNVMKSLVIWGANAYVTEEDLKIFRAIENVDKWSERMRAHFIELYGEVYFRSQWSKWIRAYNAFLKQNNGDICKDDVPKIKCPTFLLHGAKDPMVMQEHPDYLRRHINNVRYYEFPDGKHNIHLRYAKEFNALVEDFLLKAT